MFRFAEAFITAYGSVALTMFIGLPFLLTYVLADVHGKRTNQRDPNLGAKVLLSFLLTLSFQLLLAGATILIARILNDDLGKDAVKTASGLIVGSGIAAILPALLLRRVATDGCAILRRAVGINALMTGMLFVISTVIVCVMLFHEENVAVPASVAFVYGIATAVCANRIAPDSFGYGSSGPSSASY